MSRRPTVLEEWAELRVAFWTAAVQVTKGVYRWGLRLRSWRVRDLLWMACGAAIDRLIAAGRELEQLREEREDPDRAQDGAR